MPLNGFKFLDLHQFHSGKVLMSCGRFFEVVGRLLAEGRVFLTGLQKPLMYSESATST